MGGQQDVLAGSYPGRNIQDRGFDSHLSVFADNVCRCCRDGVVPAFPVEASCHVGNVDEDEDGSNPLEFKVALIFAVLFVVFTIATHYTLIYAGEGGLTLLSFVSGFSDITPFILNLLQGTGNVPVSLITACSMQAIVSNIAVNMCYALFFSGKKSPLRSWVLRGFGCVIAANVFLLLFFYFL